MAVNPFLRGMTGQQMGVGRRSAADFFTQQASPSMALPVRRPTPPQRLSAAPTQPLDIAGLRRQVLAQSAAPTAPQSRQALMAKYGLAPTAPAPKPSPMQRLSSAMPASGTPQMAGLGAAGRTMLELSGYQPIAEAPSIGQILARSAEAGIGAMEKRQEAEQAEAEKQAAAKRQEMLDAITLGEFNIKRRKDARAAAAEGQPTKPYEIYDVSTGRKVFVRDVPDGKGGFTTEQVGGVAAEKATTTSSKLFAVNIPGEDTMYLRADDPSLDDYLGDKGQELGAVVTEAPKVVGTKSEVTPGLTKASHAKMAEATFNAQNNIIKLENVSSAFEDEFLTVQGKAKRVWAELKDNLGTANPDDKAYIQAQTRWKTRAWNQVNDYIKAITGAQMSEAEARRIMKSLPNPDDSLFAVTSPTKYREALNTAIQDAKMAVARQEYFLKQGLKPEYYETSVPKEKRLGKSGFDVIYRSKDGKIIETYDMPKIMDDYTDKIASKYEKEEYSNLTDDQKIKMINQEVNSYFGLSKMPGQGI